MHYHIVSLYYSYKATLASLRNVWREARSYLKYVVKQDAVKTENGKRLTVPTTKPLQEESAATELIAQIQVHIIEQVEFAVFLLKCLGSIERQKKIIIKQCVNGYTKPHPIDCYKYLQCRHGQFLEENCHNGHQFNSEVKQRKIGRDVSVQICVFLQSKS